MNEKQVIGLTGGIASGKSEVTKIFCDLGAYIIDADEVSRKVVEFGSKGESLLKKEFPFAFRKGKLDRRVLREAVFSDGEKLAKLNSLTHNLILEEIQKRINESQNEFILVVVPLLFEVGWEKFFDKIICVTASMNIRIERLKKRDNIDDDLALKMIANQMTDYDRESRSDFIIHNDGGPNELRNSVTEVYEKIRNKT